MCSQDDLDLVRADGDGMYAREPHHPTMTDPPQPQILEEERLAGAQEHYAAVLTAARYKNALEAIVERTESRTSTTQTYALLSIRHLANAALELPPVGTRVRCLLPHRGEQGEVVAWDHDLGRPLVTWDSLRSEPPEAVEPSEYEVV